MSRRNIIILLSSILLILLLLPPKLQFIEQPFSAVIEDCQGALLSAQIASDEQWRLPFIEEVPPKFESCILTYEDKRFYNHLGVDPLALLRAIRLNINEGRVVSGGSTIPMQLARLSFDNPPRTIYSKIKEAILATKLSIWHPKRKVLCWYTSLAPFGGNVVGLNAASWRYFAKDANDLTWAQSATLAVLPNAPSLIHVNRNRSELLGKRNELLCRLHDNGTITALDLEASLLEPLPEQIKSLPAMAPHYLEYCKRENGNYKTNIKKELQIQVSSICRQLGQEWKQNGIYNAGALVISIQGGEPLAYVGNILGTSEEAQVDMIQAKRSSGSILKPFLYASMIDEGLMSPFQIQRDIPVYIGGFSPSNYNKDFAGFIPAHEALQRSLNVPSVLMLQEYGVDKFLRKLKQFGITTLTQSADHYGLSLILGGGEVTLWELAKAYRNLVLSLEGKKSIVSPGAVYHTLNALTELRRPDESGSWKRFESSIQISWKTGTSYGHRDAWAIGVTPEVVIATWVGNADGEGRDGIVGSTTAGRLLFRIAEHIEASPSNFGIPYENMIEGTLCVQSGMLPGPNCPDVKRGELAKSVLRTGTCDYHKLFYTDLEAEYRIKDECALEVQGKWHSFFVIDPVAAKYYRVNHPEFLGVPDWHPSCQVPEETFQSMTYVYPSTGEQIYLPTDLNGIKQDVVFEMAHRDPEAELFWYLDEQYLGRTKEYHTMALHPSIGGHKVTVLDISGSSKVRVFEVLAN